MAKTDLTALFTPFRLKTLELSNRIVMPPVASFLISANGLVTPAAVEHYRQRAACGPGMVIIEAAAVSAEGIVSPHQARIDDDRFTPGLARLAAAIRAEGCVPALQLHHAGRQTSANVIGQLLRWSWPPAPDRTSACCRNWRKPDIHATVSAIAAKPALLEKRSSKARSWPRPSNA